MIYKIRYLPKTVTDLTVIRVYLAQYYESTAKTFFTLLKEKTARLKEFPYSCPVYEDAPDYRKLVVGDYLVFYMVNEDNNSVEIHRIFHGSQDIKRYIKSERTNTPQ